MTLAANIGGLTITPVYKVTGKGRTQSDALTLTNIAVEEGRLLYIDLNTPDPENYRRYIDATLRNAEAKEQSAATDLETFSAAHNATGLPSQIGASRQIVETLRLEVINAQSDLAAQQATGLYANIAAAQRRLNSLSASLSNEESKLNQLTSLEAEYNRYQLKESVAQAEVVAVAGAAAQAQLTQRPAFPAEVKVLDSAQPQSPLLFVLLEFCAGGVIGLLAGATAIYVLALLERPVETAEEVGEAVGAPVLVRIPRARR
jgi:capsular polysaccharide biosynthesis protein